LIGQNSYFWLEILCPLKLVSQYVAFLLNVGVYKAAKYTLKTNSIAFSNLSTVKSMFSTTFKTKSVVCNDICVPIMLDIACVLGEISTVPYC